MLSIPREFKYFIKHKFKVNNELKIQWTFGFNGLDVTERKSMGDQKIKIDETIPSRIKDKEAKWCKIEKRFRS